ncbi:MAG: GNAT family N-acetyltransferase [bacterium]
MSARKLAGIVDPVLVVDLSRHPTPDTYSMMDIRTAKAEDKDSIRRVYLAAVGPESRLDEEYCDELIRSEGVIVAEIESHIIGFGGIDVKAREQVKWIYLVPENQGAGIGSKILERLEEIGWEAGLASLRLHSAAGAVEFYQRHRYREVEAAGQLGHDHEGVEMMKNHPR